eukprot:scaffold75142_cov57-Phaeocystis_antarctica.AAC.1
MRLQPTRAYSARRCACRSTCVCGLGLGLGLGSGSGLGLGSPVYEAAVVGQQQQHWVPSDAWLGLGLGLGLGVESKVAQASASWLSGGASLSAPDHAWEA